MYHLFCPHVVITSLAEVNLVELQEQGIRGIILDLDNTIVPWGSYDICPDIADWLKTVLGMGFKVSIVSNNGRSRVKKLAKAFALPYVSRALKPAKRGFRRALADMELKPCEVAVIGDQLLTDILGGNRLGILTIWVRPLSSREFITTKLHRRLEKLVVRILKAKGLLK